jgi:hypothetical protein
VHPAEDRSGWRGSLDGVPTDDQGSDVPATPAIPSFASLRGPQRRSPVDVLVPAQQAPPRPPEWSDLWLLGVHAAGSLVAVPGRLLRWLAGR